MENSTKKKSDRILLFARRYTALQKRYASYLYLFIYLKVMRRKMIEKVQLKGGISEAGSGITLNWGDMQSELGYKLLYEIVPLLLI